MTESELPVTTLSYLRVKALWRGVPLKRSGRARSGDGGGAPSVPFGVGREPHALADILTVNAVQMGWSAELTQASVIQHWNDIAGESIAAHSTVVEIRDGVLVVQCDSTAWATELRRLRGEILARIAREYPSADLSDLRFLAPGAPSWRHGPRSIPGRGPRDTYG